MGSQSLRLPMPSYREAIQEPLLVERYMSSCSDKIGRDPIGHLMGRRDALLPRRRVRRDSGFPCDRKPESRFPSDGFGGIWPNRTRSDEIRRCFKYIFLLL